MKEIQLTKGKVALVDDWNYEWLNQWKWHYNGRGYAVRKITTSKCKQKNIRMHRVIMNTPEGMETDHEDMNGINNQEYNLRVATHSQNRMNRKSNKGSSSKYKGVDWHKASKKWQARIMINYKLIYIGLFTCEEEAGRAYDEKAKELQGEFARLNFPD